MFWRRPRRAFTRVLTPREIERPAPRDPFLNGSGFSTGSKNAVMCPGQNALLSEAMEHGPPDCFGRRRLRAGEPLRAALPVQDQDCRRPTADARDVVRDHVVKLRLPEEGHRPLLEFRLRDAGLGLEPD